MSMFCWIISHFYDICSFWSVAVNIAVLLSIPVLLIALKAIGRAIMDQHTKTVLKLVQMIFFKFFDFSNCDWPPSWSVKITKFYSLIGSGGPRHVNVSNIVKTGQSITERYCDLFRFFKMAAAAILDFKNREILLANRVWRAESHHHAKFCQMGQPVAKILPFFFFSRWRRSA